MHKESSAATCDGKNLALPAYGRPQPGSRQRIHRLNKDAGRQADKITWCCVGFRITSVQKNASVAYAPADIRDRIRQRNRCGIETESHQENQINARLEVISHTRIAFEEILPKCCRPSRFNIRNSDLHRSQLLSTAGMRRKSLHEIATLRLRTPCDNIDIVNNSLCWQNVRKCKREKQR